jgi:putative Mg2+ transporter-C (MgtC) family protein
MITNFEVLEFALPRLGFAAVCGLLIGLERERRRAAAGIKTQILICVGSAIYTIAAIILLKDSPSGSGEGPSRMIAQIVSGIGFLGAGTILRGSEDKIFGLTTAAMIWLCAGIGILAGTGYGPACLIITFLVITAIEAVSQFEKKYVRHPEARAKLAKFVKFEVVNQRASQIRPEKKYK